VALSTIPSFAQSRGGPGGGSSDCQNRADGWNCVDGDSAAILCIARRYVTTTSCAFHGMTCSAAAARAGNPCVDSGAGTLVIGNDRIDMRSGLDRKPLRGYVDEFRMIDMTAGELSSDAFREHACNMALGSLRQQVGAKPICEQLDFRHSEAVDSDGIGTGLDFAIDAYTTQNCGSNVHRTAGDHSLIGCARAEALGISDKHLVASAVRPDFTATAFCNSCHLSDSDPVLGLRKVALAAGVIPAKDDLRRQPMAWFARMSGGAPKRGNAILMPFGANWENDSLDALLLGTTPTTPARRIGPN
jgi:hypothetical protein